jgi:hypothetical protein
MGTLNPSQYATTGHEKDSGEWTEEDRRLFSEIKSSWPELNEWGDLPLGVAWGNYSQNTWHLSWLTREQHDMSRKGLLPFIGFIHFESNTAPVPWGTSAEELTDHAKANCFS